MNAEWWVNLKQLDDDQKEVMGLEADGDYLVLGPPGSGKTNLLLLRANYLARAGSPNLLIVVFGRPLREFLARGGAQYRFDVEKITTSTKWYYDVLRLFGEHYSPTSNSFDEIRQQLIERVRAAIAKHGQGPLYDAVLLDEVQDFQPDEIALFSQLGRRLFAVGDSNQKIYSGDSGIDVLKERCTVKRLRHHYRNGIRICRFADSIASSFNNHQELSKFSNYDEAKFRSSVEVHPCDTLDEQASLIAADLARQRKAYPHDLLGVLCPRRVDVDTMFEALLGTSVGDSVMKQTFEDGYTAFAPESPICVCTIHGSKGLEFRTVHAPSIEQVKRFPRQRNLVYTLATRAKTSLSLYASGTLPGFIESAMVAINPPRALPPLDAAFGEEF